MAEIRFYHLQSTRLDQALPEIVAKALERGRRLVVMARSEERIAALSTALWSHDPASFLPHGFLRDGQESEHPVWLTTSTENPNRADTLFLADGAASAIEGFSLVCELFDGEDEEAVAEARKRWKAYEALDGHVLSYFQQDLDGRWARKR